MNVFGKRSIGIYMCVAGAMMTMACSPVKFNLLAKSNGGVSTGSTVTLSEPDSTASVLDPLDPEPAPVVEEPTPVVTPPLVEEPKTPDVELPVVVIPEPSIPDAKPDIPIVENPIVEPTPEPIIEPSPEPVDTMGRKAKRLYEVMARACQIPNKSYPKDYVPPTPAEIKARLQPCTDSIYPDTATSSAQEKALSYFDDAGNVNFLESIYSKYWYHPVYTDHFETYYGVDITDTVYAICLKGSIQGDLITPEYKKWVMDDGRWLEWLNDKNQQKLWNKYQAIRTQLKSCILPAK